MLPLKDDVQQLSQANTEGSVINLFLCILSSVNLIKIVTIHRRNSGDLRQSQFWLQEVLPKIQKELQVPFKIETIPVDFEEETYEVHERYSMEGKLLPLREKQKRLSIAVERDTVNNANIISESNFGAIVIAPKLENIDDYLRGSPRPPFKNSGGVFVIVVLDRIGAQMTLVDSALERLWRHYGIKDAVLSFCCTTENYFFFFDPFERKLSGSGTKNIEDFSSWGRTVRMDIGKCKEYYNRKLSNSHYKDLNGYPLLIYDLKVTSWKQFISKDRHEKLSRKNIVEGSIDCSSASQIDFNLFAALAGQQNLALLAFSQKMNLNVIECDSNMTHLNLSDVSAAVLSGHCSLGVQNVVATDTKYHHLDFSHPLSTDRFCIITPRTGLVPRFLGYFRCFAYSTWLLIFASHFALYFCFVCIRRFYSNSRFSIIALVQDMFWLYSAEEGLNPSFSRRLSQRIILIVILFYILTVVGIFEGFLSTWFTTDAHFKDVETLQEVDELGCILYTRYPTFHFDPNDSDPAIKSLTNKLRFHGGYFSILAPIAKGENVCLIMTEHFFQAFDAIFSIGMRSAKLNLVDECLQDFHKTFIMRKNWALAKEFNSILAQLDSAGFWNKLDEDFVDYIKIKANIRNKNRTLDDPRRAINLNDLQVPFYTLGVGLTLGFCALIGERLHYRIQRRQQIPNGEIFN